MPLIWNLKKWLVNERNIYKPVELQALLAEKAGVHLSLQTVSALINGKPSAIRIQTIEALCDALNCKLSDFCDVVPHSPKELEDKRKTIDGKPSPLYGSKQETTEPKEEDFPSPYEFNNDKRESG